MIKVIFYSLLLQVFFVFPTHANEIICDNGNSNTATWNLKANQLTVGTDTPAGTIIYTEPDDYNNQAFSISCHTDTGSSDIEFSLRLDMTAPPIANYNVDGHSLNIYPTGVRGIGVSFQDADSNSVRSGHYLSTLSTSETEKYSMHLGHLYWMATDVSAWLRIRLWRTAESLDISALNAGKLTSVFPRVMQEANAGPGYVLYPNAGTFILTVTTFNGANLKIVPGTCDIPDTTVIMGAHDNGEMLSVGSATAWSDVPDLKLTNCPVAYGYGAQGTGHNTSRNNVSVTVSPRTEIVSNLAGTFAVNDGEDSANGYGIQLAWGKSSELTDTPATLVEFNKPYLLEEFPYGDSTSSTIPIALAARYIRTNSMAKGGEANAIIDVLVNYK